MTGSIFQDEALQNGGLIGEGVVSGAALVVKSHGFHCFEKVKVNTATQK